MATLNAILDEHQLPEEGSRERFGSAPDGTGFLDWGQPFCNLLDHETIMPILRQQLGDCFRLDRIYGICMEEDTGRVLTSTLHADYGATAPFSGVEEGEYFAFKSNQIYDGFVVVTWNLTDSGPGMGGFCCIPGSHKSNYKVPRAIFDSPETSPVVVMPHGTGRFRYAVHGVADPRHRGLAQQDGTTLAPVQVLRIAHGLEVVPRPDTGQRRTNGSAGDPVRRTGRPPSVLPIPLCLKSAAPNLQGCRCSRNMANVMAGISSCRHRC